MNGEKSTILIVDDVPDDIVILDQILKKDYQVKAVTNGEAALRIARGENPPDLILLDIMMPGMDGFEVCRRLKQDAAGAMIPVIFLTAKVRTADETFGLELGAVDYIKKPIEPEVVRSRVKVHLDQKDRAVRFSEVRFRRLFEASMDGILVADKATGRVVDVNPAMAAIMGLSQEYFLGKHVAELDFLTAVLARGGSAPLSADIPRNRYEEARTADGRSIFVEFAHSSYAVNNRELVQFNIRDVTELVRAERERDKLAARLNHYLSTSPTITYALIAADGAVRCEWASDNIRALLGYSAEEAQEPGWWFSNVVAADRAEAQRSFGQAAERGASLCEYRFLKKDGDTVWLRDEVRLARKDDRESEFVGTITDISARKRTEALLELRSAALEAAANTIVVSDRDGTIRWVNKAFEKLTGYAREEVVGRNPSGVRRLDPEGEAIYRAMWETIFAGNVWSGEVEDFRKNGEAYTKEITVTPVRDETGAVSNFIAIINDISDKKRARERLEALLDEKGVLLREIHHRVNNNVQIMVGLLGISLEQIGDELVRGKLGDITRRMQSMATIHQQFYESDDMSRIDFAVYLRRLLVRLSSDFPESAACAVLDCETGDVLLNLEEAIPAGLIVNELLTNALKFAFPGDAPRGAIAITQRIRGDLVEIGVSDDGVGLPDGLNPQTAKSLGMELIRILAMQLGGTVEFRTGRGTSAILRFTR